MGERIEYSGIAYGFKGPEEEDEFYNLAADFQEAEVNEPYQDKDGVRHVSFNCPNGHRGGLTTCETIARQHFEDWISEYPHVKVIFRFSYIDHAPSEAYTLEWKE